MTHPSQEAPERRQQVEIPREEWLEFLDSFSRQHRNWLVTLEVTGGAGRRTGGPLKPSTWTRYSGPQTPRPSWWTACPPGWRG